MGVQEVLVVDPDSNPWSSSLLREGRLEPVPADAGGAVMSTSLGVSFTTGAGGRLVGERPGGRAMLSP